MKMLKWIGFAWMLGALPLVTAACNGGQQPPPVVPTTEVPPAPTTSSTAEAESPVDIKESRPKDPPPDKGALGSDKEHPVMRCGPRDSYAYVAEYQCKDGTRPLGGDLRAGGASRRGNVGMNSKGHIIDLYDIPCADNPVEVYVDMYGCPEYEDMLKGN